MTGHLLSELTVFILAVFVGFEVISKVPTLLHTPLMSGTNAIHGIVLVGALLVAGVAQGTLEHVLQHGFSGQRGECFSWETRGGEPGGDYAQGSAWHNRS